ncbi:uncharacterized protein LOC112347599 [Selaginella moellendorffii]|uniref:uncharacterized protein LOC112347599 n=1 Tax=Selaginella moellendorffii TaxID=88036 RepID=UPI000D1C4F38|nr:uncharacterized protein LOC112347599 [Selaginella moellendorffii]XP_024534468.1 uncharacterized protein LOC112347599 [Selaginella moellendorffii]XP_024534469.1 uncharacterized protein LOC112347599 [Selaginella moellendorffii]XP_024534470.1 uncharacterized protein LOC112347599 [Selaginella moellendorffii]|eukprot:XP_024534467.1 uncharacterized protein LOC112347599 [Selaginella moellendorffii]
MAGGASAVKKEAAAAASSVAKEADEPWLNANPTEHYKHYGKNLRVKNWAMAGGLLCFVAGVYAYTIHAVGSSDELQKAVEEYERNQKELQRQQSGGQVPKPA